MGEEGAEAIIFPPQLVRYECCCDYYCILTVSLIIDAGFVQYVPP